MNQQRRETWGDVAVSMVILASLWLVLVIFG